MAGHIGRPQAKLRVFTARRDGTSGVGRGETADTLAAMAWILHDELAVRLEAMTMASQIGFANAAAMLPGTRAGTAYSVAPLPGTAGGGDPGYGRNAGDSPARHLSRIMKKSGGFVSPSAM